MCQYNGCMWYHASVCYPLIELWSPSWFQSWKLLHHFFKKYNETTGTLRVSIQILNPTEATNLCTEAPTVSGCSIVKIKGSRNIVMKHSLERDYQFHRDVAVSFMLIWVCNNAACRGSDLVGGWVYLHLHSWQSFADNCVGLWLLCWTQKDIIQTHWQHSWGFLCWTQKDIIQTHWQHSWGFLCFTTMNNLAEFFLLLGTRSTGFNMEAPWSHCWNYHPCFIAFCDSFHLSLSHRAVTCFICRHITQYSFSFFFVFLSFMRWNLDHYFTKF